MSSVESMLQQLDSGDVQNTLLKLSKQPFGLPIPISKNTDSTSFLVITTDELNCIAGDFNDWKPLEMEQRGKFRWILVKTLKSLTSYKFTNGYDWKHDEFSRNYTFDDYGPMSLMVWPEKEMVQHVYPHFHRHFGLDYCELLPRTVRILLPKEWKNVGYLYCHDGQNLFDKKANFGGWDLQGNLLHPVVQDKNVFEKELKRGAGKGVNIVLVGIDNTRERMEEYYHGQKGVRYLEFIVKLNQKIQQDYAKAERIGVMGSSLGGLISTFAGLSKPRDFPFCFSLSGSMGWGRDGSLLDMTKQRLGKDWGREKCFLYLDSGGTKEGGGDGYQPNVEMVKVLEDADWGKDLYYYHAVGAHHHEGEWRERVWRCLGLFKWLQ